MVNSSFLIVTVVIICIIIIIMITGVLNVMDSKHRHLCRNPVQLNELFVVYFRRAKHFPPPPH